jgi:hypothetical protein
MTVDEPTGAAAPPPTGEGAAAPAADEAPAAPPLALDAPAPPLALDAPAPPLALDAPAPPPTPAPRRSRAVALAAVALLVALALLEAGVAVTAPLRTPRAGDWQRAAAFVRAEKRAGDLVLFAPAWVDPLGRLHLGDVITVAEEARMDAARYGRLVEVAVRGGRASETRAPGVRRVRQERFGGVTVTLYEQPRAEVVYDFLERWREARVTRWRGERQETECAPQGDKIQCPGISHNYVALRTLEPDYSARRCLYVQPVDRAQVRVAFTATLGRTLAVRTGLHDYHQRKIGDGRVLLRVLVDGREAGQSWQGSNDGWKPLDLDTTAGDGQAHEVTFEVSSPKPYARHFCFAAEARR